MAAGESGFALFTEVVAETLGLDRVARALGHASWAPYFVPLTAFVLGIGVLSSISYVIVGREQFEAVGVLMAPVASVAGVGLTKWLRRRYTDVARNLPGDELHAATLLSAPSGRGRVVVWLALIGGWWVQIALSPAETAAFIESHSVVIALAKYIFVAPLYLAVLADIVSILGAGMVALPWWVYRRDLTLDFSDPSGFAGLYELGRFLWAGSVSYFLGLTLWTAFLLLPTMTTRSSVSNADVVLFSALWVLGVVLYVAPAFLVHRHMRRGKARLVREIDAEIRALDPKDDERGIPYQDPRPTDIPRLQQKYIELQQVRSTREYPANVAIVEELALAAVLPVLFQWILTDIVHLW